MNTNEKGHNPWTWIPSLYFAEAIPYVAVMTVSVIMYKRLGMSNTDAAIYTSWLYLPWVIKPIWSPFIDLLKTKRWWILAMQILIGAALAGVALSLPTSYPIQLSIAFFWILAFSSATHDIAADGYYMLELDSHDQALFVGVRSTFYRIATIAGQGLLVVLAGLLETHTKKVPTSWSLTFFAAAGIFIAITLYHTAFLPKAAEDKEAPAAGSFCTLMEEFAMTFITFFKKPGVAYAIPFMLFYRLPEALLVKVCNLFLIDPQSTGGLGLSTQEIGLVQGTIGAIGLTAGGIIGGVLVAHGGLKKWLWPMVASLTLPNLVYVYLSIALPQNIFLISACVFFEQFGYGFGFTAYMLYLIYYSQGESKTAHYAICTAFMALSMMLPGFVSGWLADQLGYKAFFITVMVVCTVTVLVASKLKIDTNYGKKEEKQA